MLTLQIRRVATTDAMQTYQYTVQLESYSSQLVYLAEYELGDNGHFDIALDVALTIDKPKADAGRTMLHLVVCDGAAVRQIKSSQLNVTDAVPPYCAMANRTIDDYCLSYPLEDESPHDVVYRAQKSFSESMRDTGYLGVGTLYFLIDACETVGGANGVLRSCLDREGSKSSAITSSSEPDCFYCPKNYPYSNASAFANCSIPLPIEPRIFVNAAMNLCNQQDECLGADKSFLPVVYAILAGIWGFSAIVWMLHIRSFPDAAVDLQNRMKLVPLVQCAYATMTGITLYTENRLVGTARNFVLNTTILSQLFALSVSAEVVVLIAKGWKITRPTLHAREHQWIRFVTLLWATSFSILKNSMVKHVIVFLIWGISWASVVFMIWYNSAFNMNMLKYQIAMVRQMNIDHLRTPVYTKYILFRRFRGLLGLYMFLSCIFGVMGLVNDVTSQAWQWGSIVADEALNYLLYVSLGYTFRCRRFRNLLHTTTLHQGMQPVVAATATSSASIAPAPQNPPSPSSEELKSKRKATLVVVVNPDQAQSLGTTYQVQPGDPNQPKDKGGDAKSGSPTGKKSCMNGE
ncbi:hypothetical protein Gpo141_00012437 [Globisporangium polare]